jgi:hypothetical protein
MQAPTVYAGIDIDRHEGCSAALLGQLPEMLHNALGLAPLANFVKPGTGTRMRLMSRFPALSRLGSLLLLGSLCLTTACDSGSIGTW